MNAILITLALALGDADAEALDKFKTDYKAKDIAARATAVEELAKTASPKVCARLGALLGADGPEVRIAAAKGLALQQEDRKHAIVFLLNGAAANAKEPPAVLAAIVASLGTFRDEAAAPEVNRHVDAENVDLAKAAVEAAAKIKSATSFDPLIKALKECEDVLKPRQAGGPGATFGSKLTQMGTGNAQNAKEIRDRATTLKPEIIKALRDMAKVTCQDSKDWEDWWKEHRGTWKPDKS
jgi:HEAT repeat protein